MCTNYNNIGLVCNSIGDHENALAFFKEALDIGNTSLGKNRIGRAVTYDDMALAYKSKSGKSAAQSYY